MSNSESANGMQGGEPTQRNPFTRCFALSPVGKKASALWFFDRDMAREMLPLAEKKDRKSRLRVPAWLPNGQNGEVRYPIAGPVMNVTSRLNIWDGPVFETEPTMIDVCFDDNLYADDRMAGRTPLSEAGVPMVGAPCPEALAAACTLMAETREEFLAAFVNLVRYSPTAARFMLLPKEFSGGIDGWVADGWVEPRLPADQEIVSLLLAGDSDEVRMSAFNLIGERTLEDDPDRLPRALVLRSKGRRQYWVKLPNSKLASSEDVELARAGLDPERVSSVLGGHDPVIRSVSGGIRR